MDQRYPVFPYIPPASHPPERRLTFWQVSERKVQTWLTEQAAALELRELACHKRLLEAKADLVQAQMQAQLRITQAVRQAEEEEAELALERRLRSASAGQARDMISRELETERLLNERALLRASRLNGTPLPATSATSGQAASQAPAIQEHLSDQQIESLAMRAVTRFAHLDPLAADQAWETWRQELHQRLPNFAAREVERRAFELRALAK